MNTLKRNNENKSNKEFEIPSNIILPDAVGKYH
jgi:hypothetical protein